MPRNGKTFEADAIITRVLIQRLDSLRLSIIQNLSQSTRHYRICEWVNLLQREFEFTLIPDYSNNIQRVLILNPLTYDLRSRILGRKRKQARAAFEPFARLV